jgi:hypothetical protein
LFPNGLPQERLVVEIGQPMRQVERVVQQPLGSFARDEEMEARVALRQPVSALHPHGVGAMFICGVLVVAGWVGSTASTIEAGWARAREEWPRVAQKDNVHVAKPRVTPVHENQSHNHELEHGQSVEGTRSERGAPRHEAERARHVLRVEEGCQRR